MFHHGVMAELAQMKWEVELRQKQTREYEHALKSIRLCLENKDWNGVEWALKSVNV